MNRFLFFVFALFFAFYAMAQDKSVRGKASVTVNNHQAAPLEGATVELLRSRDSLFAKAAVTDKTGLAELENILPDTYLLRITAVNYHPFFSTLFAISGEQLTIVLPAVSLRPKDAAAMEGVTVTAKKPFIQKLTDRIVVNVDNSIVNAGSTAMEVLERSPGITVDGNDAIGLRGRQGVIIMIDGKPTPMSGADLANYLRGLPSNAIDRIEIITNPSAKYDAAGNSGIIDIRLKKDQRFGTNGTLTTGYGQGVYPKANGGFTVNHRNKKVNVFSNYNHGYRENLNHLILNRNFFVNGVFNGSDDKDNYAKMPFHSNTARFGVDFFPSQKTVVGFVVNGNFNGFRRTNTNNSIVNDKSYKPYYTFRTLATNNDHFNNAVANVNVKHTFDSTGRELSADADYGRYHSTSLSTTATRFYNLDGSKKNADDILDGDQDGRLTLKTAKVDYTHPLKKGAKFEAGAKTSFVSSDNDAQFFNVFPAYTQVDTTKTNRFFYNENNQAAYINFSKDYKKFNFQIGLRGEQTDIKTHQVKKDIHFDSSYFQLFPSAFFNYKLNETQTLGLSVSRRIDRPGYSQLNPFLFLIDASTYATGSPGLLPQLTWSYEASYTWKNLNFTLGYSHTKDVQNISIAKILDVIPTFEITPGGDSNITVQIPVNLESSDYFGLTVAAPVRIAKWWNSTNNINVYYNHFNGNIGGTALNNGAPAADVRTNNTFTLKNGWTTELNASFSSGGRYGYMVSRPQWGLAAGVQKTVMKSKGTVRFNVSDIFWTNRPRATITFPGRYIENWHAYRESRVANFSFTYRFGNNKVQAARRRTTASEEERQRAGN